MAERDTIVALATGTLPSALAIVRLSGPWTQKVVAALTGAPLPEPRKTVLRRFHDADGALIDEGVLVHFEPGTGFTGESAAEFTLHGGQAVVDHFIGTVLALPGTRLAEPGEFTRRAFEAGRLDLTQAEAIADLIEAETPLQKSQALSQLDGAVSSAYAELRDALIEALAQIEVMIDFTDEADAPDDTTGSLRPLLESVSEQIGAILDDDRIGEKVRSGLSIVILGPPNAGKSTLLNRLAGRDAAIVTARPGTTRDTIDVRLVLSGVPVTVTDTAGLRDTEDEIEAEGVRRALTRAEAADIRVWLDPDGSFDGAEFGSKKPEDVLIQTKIDLAPNSSSRATLAISAETGAGIDALVDALTKRIQSTLSGRENVVITRARHRQALSDAAAALSVAGRGLDSGSPVELIAEDIRIALRHLERLVGRVNVEDVLGSVFSRFCIGK